MAAEPRLALAAAIAAVAAYLLTPVAIHAAGRLDFFDQPKGYKGHAKPIPYLGGSAVLLAFIAVSAALAGDPERTWPLVGGAAVLWVVGTVDDRRHLSPLFRVVVEVAIACGLWAAGLGWDLGAGDFLDVAVTVVWIVAIVNAFNLFDNMDGATSSMAAVVSGAIAALGLWQGDPWLTVAGAALAGSCIGFLPYNLARPQARIFLGDGGSMPIGFAVAALVMTGASTAATGWESLAVGLLLVGIPLLDTTLVIISRRRKGISILTGGRDHLTHRTRRRLLTARAVALTLCGLQALVASVALVALDLGPAALIGSTVLAVAVGGACIVLLEREEDRLIDSGEVAVPEEALSKAQAKRAARPDPFTVGDLALVVLAFGAALSPLAFGYYHATTWVPLGLGVLFVCVMGAVRRPQHLPVAGWLVVGGFAVIGLVGLLSVEWAASANQAVTSANRWLVLAAVAALSLILLRSARRDCIALGALTLGSLVVAGIVLARMLGADPTELFVGGRLHQPLGYINAEATVFLMGTWLCLAAAERREPWLAGAGLAGATTMAGLALLSQSRGAAIAAAASVVVVLLAVPGRQRRAYALLVLAGSLAVAGGPLLHIYEVATQVSGAAGLDRAIADAAQALLATAVIAGGVWGAAVAVTRRIPEASLPASRRAGWAALAVVALLGVGVAGTASARISASLSAQWEAFSNVAPAGEPATGAVASGSRLVSGSGNRYEYWRVAWKTFTQEPLLGVGAGNFDRAWYQERRVSEDVRQPHSIELEVLSELGIAGGIGLLLVLAGFTLAVARVHRVATGNPLARTVAVAGVGVPTVWLVHTSADWQHLLPGTTAVALLMLAALVRQPERALASAPQPAGADAEQPADAPRGRWVALAGVGVLALIAATTAATLTRQAFADHYRAAAFDEIVSNPRQAVVEADRSLRLNDDAVRSYFAKAAGLARLGEAEPAATVLAEATRKDPTNPVAWALRGDVATRRGREADAARYYAEALRLNPLDQGLRSLTNPTDAPTGGRR